MVGLDGHQSRRRAQALGAGVGATVGKAAPRKDLVERRHGSGDGCQALAALLGVWQGVQQIDGVGMARLGKKRWCAGHLDNLAGVHERHAVGHLRDHRQVVGDQQHGHLLGLLQGAQQIQNLRLDGHVQRGSRLVSDHHIGLSGQRNGHHDALLLPARHLKGVAVNAPCRLRNTHAL